MPLLPQVATVKASESIRIREIAFRQSSAVMVGAGVSKHWTCVCDKEDGEVEFKVPFGRRKER